MPGPGGDAGDQRPRRPHRQEGDVRLQHHRRSRRDAPPARPRAGAGRHLRDGEPQLGGAGRHDRARPLHASCRSTPTATAGATCPATPRSAGPTSPGRSSGGWPASTTCMSTACGTSSAEDDESVIASARACLTPMFERKPCLVMPVFSSGQSARQAPGTYAGLGSPDLIVTAGGGIMAHPGRAGSRRGGLARGLGGGDGRHPAGRVRPRASCPGQGPGSPCRMRPRPCRTAFWSASTATISPARPRSWRCLTFAGLPTVLFLEVPTTERLARFAGHRGIGIAGVARSQSPAWMEENLPPVFRTPGRSQGTDRALQGLLDLRLGTACRLDRPGHRPRGTGPRRHLAPAGGGSSGRSRATRPSATCSRR